MSAPDVEAAAARSAAARARLQSTVSALQTRLDPRRLASDAIDGVAAKGRGTIATVGATIRRNPVAVAGIVSLGLLFLSRHRIAAALRPEADPQPAPRERVRSKFARPAPVRRIRS